MINVFRIPWVKESNFLVRNWLELIDNSTRKLLSQSVHYEQIRTGKEGSKNPLNLQNSLWLFFFIPFKFFGILFNFQGFLVTVPYVFTDSLDSSSIPYFLKSFLDYRGSLKILLDSCELLNSGFPFMLPGILFVTF